MFNDAVESLKDKKILNVLIVGKRNQLGLDHFSTSQSYLSGFYLLCVTIFWTYH